MIDACLGDTDNAAILDEAQARASGRVTNSPVQLFDAGRFHPYIVDVSRSLFANRDYAQAIL